MTWIFLVLFVVLLVTISLIYSKMSIIKEEILIEGNKEALRISQELGHILEDNSMKVNKLEKDFTVKITTNWKIIEIFFWEDERYALVLPINDPNTYLKWPVTIKLLDNGDFTTVPSKISDAVRKRAATIFLEFFKNNKDKFLNIKGE